MWQKNKPTIAMSETLRSELEAQHEVIRQMLDKKEITDTEYEEFKSRLFGVIGKPDVAMIDEMIQNPNWPTNKNRVPRHGKIKETDHHHALKEAQGGNESFIQLYQRENDSHHD